VDQFVHIIIEIASVEVSIICGMEEYNGGYVNPTSYIESWDDEYYPQHPQQLPRPRHQNTYIEVNVKAPRVFDFASLNTLEH
jgi:hypothetical protein